MMASVRHEACDKENPSKNAVLCIYHMASRPRCEVELFFPYPSFGLDSFFLLNAI